MDTLFGDLILIIASLLDNKDWINFLLTCKRYHNLCYTEKEITRRKELQRKRKLDNKFKPFLDIFNESLNVKSMAEGMKLCNRVFTLAVGDYFHIKDDVAEYIDDKINTLPPDKQKGMVSIFRYLYRYYRKAREQEEPIRELRNIPYDGPSSDL